MGDIRACGAHSRTSNTDTKLLIYGLFKRPSFGRGRGRDAIQDERNGDE